MVRTKADAAVMKVAGAKAPRKLSDLGNLSLIDKKRGSGSGSGGNPVCPRETPPWQKTITTFFPTAPAKAAAVDSTATTAPQNTEAHEEPSGSGQ